MDEAYIGSAIEDPSGNSGSDDSGPLDLADPMFLDLLKNENDGTSAKHWTSPTISSTLQAAVNNPQSDRLKQSLKMAPRFLTLYFATALRDVNDSVLCALIPVVMSRYAAMFPDKVFSFEVRRRLSDFILAAFERSPNIIALLKEPGFDSMGASSRKSSQARLLCFVVTAIAKLATCHIEFLPRARVSLAKVARSRTSDRRVWQRACDYLVLVL